MRILEAIARRILRDEIEGYERQIRTLDVENRKLKGANEIDLSNTTLLPSGLISEIFKHIGDPNEYAAFNGRLYSGNKVFEFSDANGVNWSFYFELVNHVDDYNFELVIFVYRNKTNKVKMRLKIKALKTVISSHGRECTTWVWSLKKSGFQIVSDNSFNLIHNFFEIEL